MPGRAGHEVRRAADPVLATRGRGGHPGPMLTLALLRHAKSAWDDPGLDDFDRPLAPRGVKAARTMGAYLARERLKPDLVLCSDAARARATLALLLPELGSPAPEILYDGALYLASPAALLDRLRRTPKNARRVLVIGHNPGLHALALDLIGDGRRSDITALATHFPAAALAVISFPAESWSAVAPAGGRLLCYMTPKRLD